MANPLADLIDNEKVKMVDVLKDLLQPGVKLDIAVAYFNIKAFSLLADSLEKLAQIRFLLGKEQEREFVLAGEKGLAGEEDDVLETVWKDLEKGSARAEPQFTPRLQRVRQLLEREEVKIRKYNKSFLHGKAYILTDLKGPLDKVGIIGSSNFTAGGLETNRELNAVLKQTSAVNELLDWFNPLWESAEEYKEELLQILQPFLKTYSPYEIYIKILYEYYRDKLKEEEIGEREDKPSPISLTNFQHEGYKAAREICEKYSGVLLADSVGLGKTYLATRLLDDYAYHQRQTALIICPAQLRDTLWEPILQKHAIPHEIVSMEKVSQKDFPVDDYARQYKIVVVDESHNFRNNETNRWKNLLKLLKEGEEFEKKKLLLLTATPINNTIWDLYHQLRLLTRDNPQYFREAGIGNLRDYFRSVEENGDRLYEILEAICIRRSRQFIKKHYPKATIDGKEIRFPQRELQNVDYKLQQIYMGLYDDIAKTIEKLHLAPYQCARYQKDKATIERGVVNSQRALANLMKILYLKRLESSVHAFRVSLKRQIDFQERFLQALQRGKLLDASAYRKWLALEGEEDEVREIDEEELGEILQSLPSLDASNYNVEYIKRHCERDINSLREILGKIFSIDERKDGKLQKLEELLSNEIKGKKTLIFSYFKDTARYIYKYLQNKFPSIKISIVDSEIKPEERRDRIIRFAPLSNEKENLKGSDKEIDVLISTDVLSEGQNLQDAEVIINYDLHWNPVRLVQRIGRVDRIGALHDLIYIHNFIPEDRLESLIRIVERLTRKLETINKAVGLDASVLGEKPNPQDFNTLRRIAESDASTLDELESRKELLNIGEFIMEDLHNFLVKTSENKLKKIPLGMVTGKGGKGKRGVFAAFRYKGRHFWRFYDIDAPEGKKIVRGHLSAIYHARSPEDEPYVEPDFDVQKYIKYLRRDLWDFLRREAYPLYSLEAPQNKIVQFLQSLRPSALRNELLKKFSYPLPPSLLSQLKKVWKGVKNEGIDKKLETLKDFLDKNPPPSPPPDVEEVKEEDIELVGAIALCGGGDGNVENKA